MQNVFLTSMMIGGLAEMTTKAGGLTWLVGNIRKMIRGPKTAEAGIMAMCAAVNMAIANNTVSLIVAGPVCREICAEYKIDPRRSAALMDSTVCAMQGALPYGAQILMVTGWAGMNPEASAGSSAFGVMSRLWYQQLLAVFALASIYIPFANGTIRRNPWNFDKWKSEDELAGKVIS